MKYKKAWIKGVLTLVIIVNTLVGHGQNFAVTALTNELTDKASCVVRFHHTEFVVKDIGQASVTISGAVTVLDEKGERQAAIVIPYNKFTKIKDIEAQLYDAQGQRVKRLKRSEIENFSTNSGDNSIDDSFVKVAVLKHTTYPYTVAFAYEFTTSNMMIYPTWEAVPNNLPRTAVEQSSLTVTMPQGLKLRYLEQNMPSKATITEEGGQTKYNWAVKNMKAVEEEPYAPPLSKILPCVYTGPTEFMVEGYRGNLSTWADFGTFYRELNKDRYNLPPQTVNKVKELVKGVENPQEKVQKLYTYLQGHTRYVSIQLGLGGWQSMKAEEVATKGYGDCKALTTYLGAMLKEVGIKSYPVLVKAGADEGDIQATFPSFQFNHLFLCVPSPQDTIWLECTSQTAPFGYLGSFTGDRHAVLITENGGVLIKTPSYRPEDNQQLRHALVNLQENGEATIDMKTYYTGIQQETVSGVMHAYGKEEQKKWLVKSLSLSSLEIQKFSFEEYPSALPAVEEKVYLFAKNVYNKSSSRLFLSPNQFNVVSTVPLPNALRKYDFEISSNYLDIDSITYLVPKGYIAEYLPEKSKVVSKFGEYEAESQKVNDRIIYTRKMKMKKGLYPASTFNEWVEFRKKIVKLDKNQIVLVQEK